MSRDFNIRVTVAEETGRRQLKIPVRASTAHLAILVGLRAAVLDGLLPANAAIVKIEL
jgi:hypothetical protein